MLLVGALVAASCVLGLTLRRFDGWAKLQLLATIIVLVVLGYLGGIL